MPRIVTCVEHTRYYGSLDFTPIEPQEEGHVLATAVSADGVVRLDCYFCTWTTPPAMDTSDTPCPVCHGEVGHRVNCPNGIAFSKDLPAVEKALGSVGNPALTTRERNIVNRASRIVNIRKKEKNVAKEKSTEPKKRDRTPKRAIVSRKFGPNIEVAVYLKGGTIEDVLALPEAERTALFDLLTSIKAETPKEA